MKTLKEQACDEFRASLIWVGAQRIEYSRKVVKGDSHDFEFARQQLEDDDMHQRYYAELAKRLGIEGYDELRAIVEEAALAADVDGWIGQANDKLAKLKSIGA